MSLWLAKLQKSDKKVQKLSFIEDLHKGWTNINRIRHYQGLLFVLELI